MYRGNKVVVVMPAYNAAETLLKTHKEVLEQNVVDEVIVVDDGSVDETVRIAESLPRTIVRKHRKNRGYGANQKTCYKLALENGADIVIMVHPDYQYTPKLITAMVTLIGNGLYHCVLGSRILGGYALKGGMPLWRYVANRGLTFVENVLTGGKLSEFHTGYRAFSRELLECLSFERNSDDFVFDNQILLQVLWHRYTIGEISCPSRYSADSSSINFLKSLQYGLGCLLIGILYRLAKMGLIHSRYFPEKSH
jgi:glycosyltransferase involved in cell wall biosynthesis